MSVGFVTEGGQAVVNYVQTGASTIFPQGESQATCLILDLGSAGKTTARLSDALPLSLLCLATCSLRIDMSGYEGFGTAQTITQH